MALGKKRREKQKELWVATCDLPETGGHPFYSKLERLFVEAQFDDRCEKLAKPHYAKKMGRPGLPAGVYARMLLIGYFEGIPSERGIAWRCADSLSLRQFLDYEIHEATPDHSTLSRTRTRLPIEFHQEVFSFVLEILARKDLVKGNTLAVDASTMEANAAMKSIVRRDTGQAYLDFLKDLAKESGIETPTLEDLKKLDRKRKKKGSNDDWMNPFDPDAKITKMKDGRTHFAYKVEHAVDLDTEVIIQPSIHPANEGDTTTGPKTVEDAQVQFADLADRNVDFTVTRTDIVEDKGYHSGRHLVELEDSGFTPYISEPNRGRRRWKNRKRERDATYSNRRRMKGERSKKLHRRRAEVAERSFAHVLETGGMRRTWLRGLENVWKRYLIHTAGFNLAVLMRKILGYGTPRGLADALKSLIFPLWAAVRSLREALLRRILPTILFSSLARLESRFLRTAS